MPDARAKPHIVHDKAPDVTLLVQRLEAELLAAPATTRQKQIVANADMWRNLAPAQQRRWAMLAQLADAHDTALKIYEAVHQADPQDMDAWCAHADLLRSLSRPQLMTRMLARAQPALDNEQYQLLQKRAGQGRGKVRAEYDEAVDAPFERLHDRRARVAQFLRLFAGRSDHYARQWVERSENRQGYAPVRGALTESVLQHHFNGTQTLGIYLMQPDATVRLAVIDADLNPPFRQPRLDRAQKEIIRRDRSYMHSRIASAAAACALQPLVEYSGQKGYHYWFFFARPIAAAEARRLLKNMVQTVAGDLQAFALEVFPKQDHLSGKGLGNLVKLPLGVHRVSGKRSCFVYCKDRGLDAQLDFLETVTPGQPTAAQPAPASGKVCLHPRFQAWAAEYPELYQLHQKCPPLGQAIDACINRQPLRFRERRVLLQTLGFLRRRKTLLHYLLSKQEGYNRHEVDFFMSKIRGTPMGCKRIHSLLDYTGDFCRFPLSGDYACPLRHLDEPVDLRIGKSEKIENLTDAVENLKLAIAQLQPHLPQRAQ